MADPVQPSNVAVAVATSALKAEQPRMRDRRKSANDSTSTPRDPYRRQVRCSSRRPWPAARASP